MLILFLLLVSHALQINFPCTFMVGCIVVLTAVWNGIWFCWSHTVAHHTYSSLIKMVLILSVEMGRFWYFFVVWWERRKEIQERSKNKKNGQNYPIISFFKSLIFLEWINENFIIPLEMKTLSFKTFSLLHYCFENFVEIL